MNQDHKKLHEKFSALGRERNKLTYELLAMLPQIYIEGVYREHRCATIYEYAGKYAGLSHSVVEKTLKLHKELEGKPCLREAIRTQGVHKVALVAKIATAETDWVLAQRVKDMSQPALQELSKELRQKVEVNRVTIEQIAATRNDSSGDGWSDECAGTGAFCLFDEDKTVNPRLCHAAQESMTISLDPEMQFLFLKLKKKLEKKEGVNLSNKQGLKLILEELESATEKRAEVGKSRRVESANVSEDGDNVAGHMTKSGVVQRKGEAVKNFVEEKMDGGGEVLCDNIAGMGVAKADGRSAVGAGNGNEKVGSADTKGKGVGHGIIANYIAGVRADVKKVDSGLFKRYIPMVIRKVVLNETRGRCAYPGCNKPYENFHHRERFGSGGSHESIVPVCGAHHEFAHNGLVGREFEGTGKWELDLVESGGKSFADKKCIERRMVAVKDG